LGAKAENDTNDDEAKSPQFVTSNIEYKPFEELAGRWKRFGVNSL
jgi:hypothetical protein